MFGVRKGLGRVASLEHYSIPAIKISVLMRTLYRLFLSVWCLLGCQICKNLELKKVHLKKKMTIGSNFFDNTLNMHYH